MSLVRFSNQFPASFERLFENDLFDWTNRNFSTTNTTLPSVNIIENTEGYEVEMAAPGLKKEDFNIELNNDLLTISSEKQMENESKKNGQYTKREFSYQSFSRSFTLPRTVENEKISAKYENGLLKVMIPKREEAKPKPKKQIAIS
jgi:HSP20 family protein